MLIFSKHHIHYHILLILIAVWGIVFKLELFKASALGEFILAQPKVSCVNSIPNVSLEWSPSTNSLTYSIERMLGSNQIQAGFGDALMSQLTTKTYIDNRYLSDYTRGAYSYRIVAYGSDNTQTYSNVVTVVLPECVPGVVDPFATIATSTVAIYNITDQSTTTPTTDTITPTSNIKRANKKSTRITTTTTTVTPVTLTQTSAPAVVAQAQPAALPQPVSQTVAQQPSAQQIAVTQPVVAANIIPIAWLELPYFATSTVSSGTSISFMGSGDDDGPIVAYEWRLNDCTTGTVISTATSFSKSDFPVGLTYVYFRVMDSQGAWSTNCQRRAIIVTSTQTSTQTPTTVSQATPVANKLPTVSINVPVALTTNVTQGTSVTFTGTASDPDGTISGYEWRDGSCTTGVILSSATSFSKSDLAVGTHTMFFRAKDNSGAWSNCVSRVVVVSAVAATAVVIATTSAPAPINKIPTATITTPTFATSSITTGTSLSFSGSASDPDGTISGYEWRDGSCTTGTIISTVASFSKSDFTVGVHQIYFRAKDNSGAWSTDCQKRAVIVSSPVVTTQTPAVTTPSTTTTTTTQTSTPATSGKIPSWMKWGAFVGWQDTAMSNFESLVGKQPQMEAVFTHWGNDQFPSFYAPRIRDKGRTMVIFWEAVDYNRDYFSQPEYSFDAVIRGDMDPYFKQFATDAKAYGGDIILVPYSEFNSDWFPWGITIGNNTPEKFKQAWIHIHDIFTAQGVSNVKFGWVPNNDSIPDTAANNFDLAYPGSQYVDVVGIDGFNDTPWETFDTMVGGELTRLKKYAKPIYIMSMGVKADARKAAWITDMAQQLYKYPEVKGWIWFNENKEKDWRVNSDASALSAFKAILP